MYRVKAVRARGDRDETFVADELGHASAGRTQHHLVRPARLQDGAIVDYPQLITESLRLAEVVGDEDAGRFALRRCLDGELAERLTCHEVHGR